MTRYGYLEMGVLFLSEKNYGYSARGAYQRRSSIMGNPTVGDVLDLIFNTDENNIKLDCYKLSPTGQGCAYWVYKLMERIERAGYIERGEAGATFEDIQWLWDDGHRQYKLGLQNRKGEFM
jgi:hypothetical protein